MPGEQRRISRQNQTRIWHEAFGADLRDSLNSPFRRTGIGYVAPVKNATLNPNAAFWPGVLIPASPIFDRWDRKEPEYQHAQRPCSTRPFDESARNRSKPRTNDRIPLRFLGIDTSDLGS